MNIMNQGTGFLGALIASALFLQASTAGLAAESTMPATYRETIEPTMASKYVYTQDGPFADASGLPTYQWLPAGESPGSMLLAIHGLTLHGRRFRVLARTLAVNKIGVVSVDMRGFGRCRFDDNGKEKPRGERTSINHELSYQDIAKAVRAIKARYPDIPLILVGESLGCTFCIRLAAEFPDLIAGIALSAPAVRVNPKMYTPPKDVKAILKPVLTLSHQVDLHKFLSELVSSSPDVVNEMMDDPFIIKTLALKDLLSTDAFVDKTVEWSKNTAAHLPLLVIQGSNDKCVLPKHLTDLLMNMRSDDMRIAWKGSYGHLQLETSFMRASVVESLGDWLHDHSQENRLQVKKLEQDIADLGGTLVH